MFNHTHLFNELINGDSIPEIVKNNQDRLVNLFLILCIMYMIAKHHFYNDSQSKIIKSLKRRIYISQRNLRCTKSLLRSVRQNEVTSNVTNQLEKVTNRLENMLTTLENERIQHNTNEKKVSRQLFTAKYENDPDYLPSSDSDSDSDSDSG